MKYIQKYSKSLLFTGSMVLAVGAGIFSYSVNTDKETIHSAAGSSGAYVPCTSRCAADAVAGNTYSATARRLQKRLDANGERVPGVAMLEQGLQERNRFIRQTITVNVSDSDIPDAKPVTWSISFAQHPELITLKTTWPSASFSLDKDLLSDYLTKNIFGDTGKMTSAVVTEIYTDKKRVVRTSHAEIARDGYVYDMDDLTSAIDRALRNGSDTVTIDVPFKKSTVSYSADGKTRELTLLSTGLSDFSNSPAERISNVYKATNEHVNNVIVPKGSTYSFVDILDAPVTVQKGWKEAMGLFGGGAAMTPGAGICQLATTVYRAALLAGMPITNRRYHSMFVDHYETYGIGLDATIFPGIHDMTFKNDTSDVILIQAYTVGDDVFVNFYGDSDGRTVALDGPYFNITPNRNRLIRPLDWDEVGWVSTVTYPDGRVIEKSVVSTYVKGFAKSIKLKYAGTLGMELLTIKEPAVTVADAHTSY